MIIESIDVTYDRMLSLFVGANIQHPYRLQPNIKLVISYTEYRKFLDLMLRLDKQVFSFSNEYYLEAIRNNDEVLLKRYYLYDMVTVITNELLFSLKTQYPATQIVHKFDDEDVGSYSPNILVKIFKKIGVEHISKESDKIVQKRLGGLCDIGDMEESQRCQLYYASILQIMSKSQKSVQFV